ncbi:hypothetical protein HK18_05860 [Commensalibacter intestini]|uniref:Uncharacterized protein n=1 Tax=Commensalibacter intestini TaxID=479936 RepID=A0A251ZW90_9PROT|nr:hypothetical protein [Commensalibacter intestini]OUI78913.1 hypothetical protein HK18_05860 [Commensalibacter intestini]
MNTIFINANKHPNGYHCDHSDLDRFHRPSQLTNTHRQQRIQIDVSKNYTGQQLRLLEDKKALR